MIKWTVHHSDFRVSEGIVEDHKLIDQMKLLNDFFLENKSDKIILDLVKL